MTNTTFIDQAYLTCPITMEIMKDPVTDYEGNSYEREAIVAWLTRNPPWSNGTSPITGNPLRLDQLIPNRALKNISEERKLDKRELLREFIHKACMTLVALQVLLAYFYFLVSNGMPLYCIIGNVMLCLSINKVRRRRLIALFVDHIFFVRWNLIHFFLACQRNYATYLYVIGKTTFIYAYVYVPNLVLADIGLQILLLSYNLMIMELDIHRAYMILAVELFVINTIIISNGSKFYHFVIIFICCFACVHKIKNPTAIMGFLASTLFFSKAITTNAKVHNYNQILDAVVVQILLSLCHWMINESRLNQFHHRICMIMVAQLATIFFVIDNTLLLIECVRIGMLFFVSAISLKQMDKSTILFGLLVFMFYVSSLEKTTIAWGIMYVIELMLEAIVIETLYCLHGMII